ncbi:MAG: LPS assembly lipoprotein LptE [Alphaproteobacteria bacterium]|nr:LPS assembly lipoprotein LptE [Alphaproteobacteria bacterium]
MKSFRYGIIALALLSLSGCGFQPLYGDHSLSTSAAVRESLNQIEISNIPDRSGQYLKNALMDRLYSAGRPAAGARYRLTISPVGENRRELDITKTSDSTRAQLSLSTVMVLADAEGQELLSRRLNATTSYNILDSQFTTRVAEDSARRQALDDLARQIESHILLYFNR